VEGRENPMRLSDTRRQGQGPRRNSKGKHPGRCQREGRGITPTRHGLPEASLSVPTVLFSELVVPGGNISLVVAAQAGEIEVKAILLGQLDQFREPVRTTYGPT
jgi:hypothetical protein